MPKPIKILAGSYWDFWFTGDEIIRIQVVPSIITTIFMTVFFVVFGLLLGLFEGIVGILAGFLLGNAVCSLLASRRRKLLIPLPAEQLPSAGFKFVRLPWSDMTGAELKGKRLTVRFERGRIKIPIPASLYTNIKDLAKSKLGDKFVER